MDFGFKMALQVRTGSGSDWVKCRMIVEEFVGRYNADLAPRVRREVNTKLKTGLKNPKKRS